MMSTCTSYTPSICYSGVILSVSQSLRYRSGIFLVALKSTCFGEELLDRTIAT